MSDQGEKIIHLAREMLRENHEMVPHAKFGNCPPTTKHAVTLKIAAITAIISAFGGASLASLVDEMRRPINRYEQVEIEALIFYAARQNALTKDAVKNETEKALALTSILDINAMDYRRVRDYLREKIKG
ncbi:MAG: hypothetical protein PHD48_09745 [Alphaproteobacteria bacterium]|nr:hypothetical protein [Alphaproteobacteria bacterium]